MTYKILSFFLVAFILTGCATVDPTVDPTIQIRKDLDALAEQYESVKEVAMFKIKAGDLKPEEVAFLLNVDAIFEELFSKTIVDLNDTFDPAADWKKTLSIVLEVLTIAAPVFDAVTGTPAAAPILSAIKLGAGMIGGQHVKRGYDPRVNYRLRELRREAARLAN